MTIQTPDPDAPRSDAGSPLAPAWLNHALAILTDRAAVVPPVRDNREDLPEFIYRH